MERTREVSKCAPIFAVKMEVLRRDVVRQKLVLILTKSFRNFRKVFRG